MFKATSIGARVWIEGKNKVTSDKTKPGGVLNFGLGTDVRPEVSTTTL